MPNFTDTAINLAGNNQEYYTNIDYGGRDIARSGARSADYSKTMAQLTKDQWYDFKNRYLPVQNELLSLANSDQLLNEQLGRNKQNLDASFTVSNQNEARRMQRYGLTPENSTQDNNNRNLLKSLTTASVNNETRSAVEDLQNKIVTGQGGAPKSLAEIGRG